MQDGVRRESLRDSFVIHRELTRNEQEDQGKRKDLLLPSSHFSTDRTLGVPGPPGSPDPTLPLRTDDFVKSFRD